MAGYLVVVALLVVSPPALAAAESPRHVIYLHGRIVQEQQSARPQHPSFGYYELEQIIETFRERGFVVHGGIRPKPASVAESAERVVGQVRDLLAAGVEPDHITIVGASMGASIALQVAVQLEHPELRFSLIGACQSTNLRALIEEGKAPSGRLLFVSEASDDLAGPCPPWEGDPGPRLVTREIVLETGLSHGFLYRPLPEWVRPVVEWARTGGQ